MLTCELTFRIAVSAIHYSFYKFHNFYRLSVLRLCVLRLGVLKTFTGKRVTTFLSFGVRLVCESDFWGRLTSSHI